MRTFEELLLSNKGWAREMQERKADFFTEQTRGQNPEILWIGCSDSRVSPDQITQTRPGELFIHRNIANLVHEDDDNLASVVQFAVETLRVRHVVVCGHYGCGGIEAALEGNTEGPIDKWLENARQVERDHAEELKHQTDHRKRVNRLVELNVRDQLVRLSKFGPIRAAHERGDELWLHGMVYDLRDGLISELLTIGGDDAAAPPPVPETVLAS
ncbi:carbonic anhydrase [Croceicoccus sp. YJ47]|uniref:carbonic anhydrase n=1 Tax=Croceicoccus sp. YJ47 TaxID=2798724 RepID=UPI001920D9ED|nr:carbonic anhydrase [Croceicoccus sp. YJ47]QQN74649.1 carbonic anhydrase [Croceicoccus sp. YJ47]